VTRPAVAFFAMEQPSHLRRLLPLIAGVARRGIVAHVFTHRRLEESVRRAGGTFVDLFRRRSLEEVDATSRPLPCRFVTFAAECAEEVAADLREIGARAVIHDTFAVVGYVAARRLGVPCVNVCAGHSVDPARFAAWLRSSPLVDLSPACLRAVERLRERYGLPSASPFLYVATQSPDLNVYCEPEAFLAEAERRPFEPIAFHGSLPAPEDAPPRDAGPSPFGRERGALNVYVSLGTVAWRYFPEAVLSALAACAEAIARLPSARGIVSLAGVDLADDRLRRLSAPNVRVEREVDQWAVLSRADVFVTHHGLNSTHEAILHGVPMISYPTYWDQPALARRCRDLGLAIPLSEEERGPVCADDVLAALGEFERRRGALQERLREAAGWERDVIERRGAVLDRIEALIRSGR